MTDKPRDLWERLPREQRKAMVAEVQAFFLDERGEEIGDLAATFLLERIAGVVGPSFYNLGLGDAQKVFGDYADLVAADVPALMLDEVRPQEPADD